MSGPKTAEFNLAGVIVAAPVVVGVAGVVLVSSVIEKLREERQRIEAERNRRFAEQTDLLKQGEMQWRANQLREHAEVLLVQIRDIEATTPALAGFSNVLSESPPTDSLSELERYVSTLSRTVQAAKQRLNEIKVVAHSDEILKKLAAEVGAIGQPRRVSDVLPDAGQSLRVEVEQPIGLEGLREDVADAVREFSTRHRLVLPSYIADQISDLYRSQDVHSAVGLGLQIRNALAQEENCIEKEKTEAKSLIESIRMLPAENPGAYDARERLGWVLSGDDRLTDELKGRVKFLHDEYIRQEREREHRAAEILRDALDDLGYAVDSISDTLFVDGGTVHINKPEWGSNYIMRMRVNAEKDSLNFNMVRLGNPDSVTDDTQSKLDAAMEHDWCGDFYKLRELITSRGIETAVTRHLKSGEAPVQVVPESAVDTAFRARIHQNSQKNRQQQSGQANIRARNLDDE